MKHYVKVLGVLLLAGVLASCSTDDLEEDLLGTLSDGGTQFVDLDYSPKLSNADENVFLTTVIRGDGTFETYKMTSEGNDLQLMKTSNQQGLLSDLVGQAFGPDVQNKQNDFAYARDIGSKVQLWVGEQKNNEIEYFNRQRFEVAGEFVDLDYSPKLSTSEYNAFLVTVNDGGTFKTYRYNSEGNTPNHKTLVASSANQSLLSDLVGQAFGPDVQNKQNDFAYARDIGSKVQLWVGEQKNNEIEYFNRQRFEVAGEFVDLDYSPKLSTSEYNAFLVTVNDGGTFKTYRYNSEGNTPNHKTLVASSANQSLLSDLVGQAFGPDVQNKQNDFRYARNINNGVQYWIGEQKNNEIEYYQRGRIEIKN